MGSVCVSLRMKGNHRTLATGKARKSLSHATYCSNSLYKQTAQCLFFRYAINHHSWSNYSIQCCLRDFRFSVSDYGKKNFWLGRFFPAQNTCYKVGRELSVVIRLLLSAGSSHAVGRCKSREMLNWRNTGDSWNATVQSIFKRNSRNRTRG